ncbi:hypothetical protein Bca52824_094016 [Brassica carinata]|uniref:Cation/H+ exchanger transmembrane domain-containing protein n=1 Tax=Brassica carinata TaxID=52824 RepID=A0A8X7P4T1_BRACI|nr:hypothetical protein Bca52824_094016 [Brassica carinata]
MLERAIQKMTIMLFGAIGTAISCTVTTLAIGAIFAATDSVCALQVPNQDETPLLYSFVFGEGVVNDATSVLYSTLFRSLTSPTLTMELLFNFLETPLSCFSSVPCLVFHTCPHMACLMMLMAYLSYMLAELFDLSGILTVFFCGIVMSHYTWHNVTESTRITTKHTFGTLSFLAGTFIFLYVGMDALDIDKWRIVRDSLGTSVAVSSILTGLLMLGRAAFVFPLSFLSNLAKKNQSQKINFKMQVVIWWSGLMRGAVSMALAYNKFTMAGHTDLLEHAIMITSTITVCLYSTVVFDMLTKPLIRYLLPHQQATTNKLSDDNNKLQSIQVPLLDQDPFIEEVARNENVPPPDSILGFLTRPTRTVHYYWKKLDDSFMRPVFGGRGFGPFVPGSRGGDREIFCWGHK